MADGGLSYQVNWEVQQALANLRAFNASVASVSSNVLNHVSQINRAFASIRGPQINVGGAGLSGLTQQAGAAQQALGGVSAAGASAAGGVAQAGNAAGGAAPKVKQLHEAWGALKSLMAFEIGKEVAMEFVHIADEATQASNRIKAATKTNAESDAVWKALVKTAQETRQPLERTAEDFQQVTVATNSLGLSYRSQISLTKELNQLLVTSGASGQRAKAGISDLLRGLAAGKITSQELRGMVHDVPQLGQAIAQGLGVGIGALKGLAKEGKLTAKEVVPALQKMAPEIAATFAKMTPTIAGGFEVIKTGLMDVIHNFNESTGILKGFSLGLIAIGTHMPEVLAGLAGIGAVLVSTAIPAVWAFTTALLANPLTWIAVAAAAAGAAIVHFGSASYTIAGQTVTGWQVVRAVFAEVSDGVKAFFALFSSGADNQIKKTQQVGAAHQQTWSNILEITKTVTNAIIGFAVGSVNAIGAAWKNLPGIMNIVWVSIQNGAAIAVEAIVNSWQLGLRAVAGAAKLVAPTVGNAINSALDGVSVHLPRAKFSAAGKAAGTAVTSAMSSAFKTDYVGRFASGVIGHLKQIKNEAASTSDALDNVHGGMGGEGAEDEKKKKKKKEKAAQESDYDKEVRKLRNATYDEGLDANQLQLVDAFDQAGLERSLNTTGKLADNIRSLVKGLQEAHAVRLFSDEMKTLQEAAAKLNATEEEQAQIDARKAAGLSTDLKVINEKTKAIDAQASANYRLAQAKKDADADKGKLDALNTDLKKAGMDHQAKQDGFNNPNQGALAKTLNTIQKQKLEWQSILDKMKSIDAVTRQTYQTQIEQATADAESDAKKQDTLDKTQKLSDFLQNMWQNPREAMKQFFSDFLKQLLMSIAKATILKGLLGGKGGGSFGSMITGALTSAFGGGKAVGGDVSSSSYYLVGERGPELFAPGRSGTIIPNKNAFAGSAASISFGDTHLTINGNANEATRQQMNYDLAAHRKQMTLQIRKENASRR